MSKSKSTLTIKQYWNNGRDLEIEVGIGFVLLDRVKNSIRITRLIVSRKPDKYSSRLGMFAYLHKRNGYQSLGFPEVVLTQDKYSDGGKFISRVMYGFPNVAIESLFMRDELEEITFICSGFNQMEISQVEVSFD
jgi:hypothetical protein